MARFPMNHLEQQYMMLQKRFPQMVLELDDAIDGAALQQAVEEALPLHPLFRTRIVRCGVHGERDDGGAWHCFEEASALPVVRPMPWSAEYVYGTEADHRFPWLLTFDGNRLLFTCVHALTDGLGSLSFLQQVLRGYYRLVGRPLGDGDGDGGNSSSSGGSGGDGMPSSAARETIADPYAAGADEGNVPLGVPDFPEPMPVDKGLFAPDASACLPVVVSIPLAEVQRRAELSETSTSTVCASYLARTMERLLGWREGVIKVNMVATLRGVAARRTDRNFIYAPDLHYDIATMGGLSNGALQTVLRGQLELFIEQSNMVEQINRRVLAARNLAERLAANDSAGPVLRRDGATVAQVRYSHMTTPPFPPDLMARVRAVSLAMMPRTYSPPTVFAANMGGTVSLTVMSAFKDDAFVECLKRELELDGVPFRVERLVLHGDLRYAW